MNHELVRATGEFWRCPHSGRILSSQKGSGDNKVLCGCGKTVGSIHPNGMPFDDASGTHFKRYLPKATADDYIRQEEARD